jgi:hypothetical protein
MASMEQRRSCIQPTWGVWNVYKYIYVCIYICMYTYTYVCICIIIYIYAYKTLKTMYLYIITLCIICIYTYTYQNNGFASDGSFGTRCANASGIAMGCTNNDQELGRKQHISQGIGMKSDRPGFPMRSCKTKMYKKNRVEELHSQPTRTESPLYPSWLSTIPC